MNACLFFSGIVLNHSMASLVLLHRFALVVWVSFVFMSSKIFLLIIPISDLLGFISLQVGL